MSVLLLNITGNIKGFEDQFCENIKAASNSPMEILTKRGLDLFNSTNFIDGYQIVVVMAHSGNSEQTSTFMDTGLDLSQKLPTSVVDMLNSPTILTQIIGRNSVKYILFFCACSALSSELLASVIDDDSCMGIISSSIPISGKDYQKITEIIDGLYNGIVSGTLSNTDIDSIIIKSDISKLYYNENYMRVTEGGT